MVDASTNLRPVTHVASGALYGLSANGTPDAAVVDPLHPSSFVQMAPGGKQLPNGSITVPVNAMNASNGYQLVVTPSAPTLSATYKLQNVNSGLVLGITNASTSAGADALLWTGNGTADHLWWITPAGNGEYKIVNVNSGLDLGINGASTASGALTLQRPDNATNDHLWKLVGA